MMIVRHGAEFIALLAFAVFAVNANSAFVRADENPLEAIDSDFVRNVKPIFERHCIKCHGADRREAGLRLDSGGHARIGGDSGLAIEPGKSAESRLLIAIRGNSDEVSKMPPEGPELSDAEIAAIARWIDAGAVVSSEEPVAGSNHWAFQTPRRPAVPQVASPHAADEARSENAIDNFIVARLEAAGIEPSPAADRVTLIRRLSLDLTGVPPTIAEVDEFVGDERPDAYSRLVDRLLASPRYGERWGRHWLDAARYADSNGFTRDFAREIWKYRDWVIAAINSNMPFDQFTIEQIAGDMLPDATLEQRIATGFHRNTLFNEEGGTDDEQFRVDAVADRVATTGAVFLGLTLECARCHSHKYDPISQREFYQMFALLNNCDEPKIDAPYDWQIESGELARRDEIRERIARLEKDGAMQRAKLDEVQVEWEKTVTPELRNTLPGPVQSALMVPIAERNETQRKLVYEVFAETEIARQTFNSIAEINRLRKSEPAIPTTMVLRERSEPRETFVHLRGNFLDHGPRVSPGVPEALGPLDEAIESPTRLDFARWLVDPQNPLTPRVVMNRSWQRFFGRGIVETENDFGTQGTPPTHPELLDWLAVEFVESGWDMKHMHRLIVTSATYRQSSRQRSDLRERDPRNLLLARQARLRLDAEIIRDSALAASGLLSNKVGGPSVHPPQPEGVFDFTQDKKPWNVEQNEDRYRRGMYTFFWRSSPYPALILFDAADGNVTCTRRVRSNTPLQALTLANDEQFVECAIELAAVVLRNSDDDEQRAERMFRRSLDRRPTTTERDRLLQFVDERRAEYNATSDSADLFAAEPAARFDVAPTELAAWASAARVLLNLDEFITRE